LRKLETWTILFDGAPKKQRIRDRISEEELPCISFPLNEQRLLRTTRAFIGSAIILPKKKAYVVLVFWTRAQIMQKTADPREGSRFEINFLVLKAKNMT